MMMMMIIIIIIIVVVVIVCFRSFRAYQCHISGWKATYLSVPSVQYASGPAAVYLDCKTGDVCGARPWLVRNPDNQCLRLSVIRINSGSRHCWPRLRTDRLAVIDDCLALIEDRLALIEDRLALIEDCLALIVDCLAIIEDCLALIEDCLALIEDCLALMEDRP